MKEILNAPSITSPDCRFRDMVSAQSYTLGDTSDGQISAAHPEVYQLHEILAVAQFCQPGSEGPPCECRLEGKIRPLFRQIMKTIKHEPACFNRYAFRIESRQPLSDDI